MPNICNTIISELPKKKVLNPLKKNEFEELRNIRNFPFLTSIKSKKRFFSVPNEELESFSNKYQSTDLCNSITEKKENSSLYFNINNISRPRNGFIISRNLLQNVVWMYLSTNNYLPGYSNINTSNTLLEEISDIISKVWSNNERTFQQYFYYLAALEDNWHENMYPNYKYSQKIYTSSSFSNKIQDIKLPVLLVDETHGRQEKPCIHHALIKKKKEIQKIYGSVFHESHFVSSCFTMKSLSVTTSKKKQQAEEIMNSKNKYSALKKAKLCTRFSIKNADGKSGKKYKDKISKHGNHQPKTKKKIDQKALSNFTLLNDDLLMVDPCSLINNNFFCG